MPEITEYELANAGDGRWVVVHESTQSIAGRVVQSGNEFMVTDGRGEPVGTFESLSIAVTHVFGSGQHETVTTDSPSTTNRHSGATSTARPSRT